MKAKKKKECVCVFFATLMNYRVTGGGLEDFL